MLDLIVSVPDHCLSFYFDTNSLIVLRQRQIDVRMSKQQAVVV